MAISYKILGQANPAPNANVDLYVVPSGRQAIISTLNICNTSVSNVTFRASVRQAGATGSSKQFLAYDTALPGQDSIGLTLGMTLDATDVVTVYSFQGNVAFNLFGSEIY
jgi:hypothetical protein